MNQKNLDFVTSMNIKTNATIINQCDNYNYIESEQKESILKMFSFNERGVGRSRNNALMRANADICLLSDDDVIYNDDYINLIENAFVEYPQADVIVFNVPSTNLNRPTANILKNKRINYFSFMRYGAVNIAFRREKIQKANIYFSLLFGGGARYSAGEDSMFLYDCLKKGLCIYSNTSIIAYVNQDDSTWFNGYNEKYFFDKGVFFSALSRKASSLLVIQFAIRKYKAYRKDISFFNACKFMLQGIKHFNEK
ncbi:glycosyltransferase family A protein [Paenibacillus sp. FSL K6-3182]|uniref:glycosyltransferase family A protein n=1 Tax=Paenibacillus sp. FSL K6-3182 TaxID=2921495 RepID=UPI0030CC16E9